MPQSTDVIIDGAGYMIEPGTPSNPGYRRSQEGFPEGLADRLVITDFVGGAYRDFYLEKDVMGTSMSVAPTSNGQSVKPWFRKNTIGSAGALLTFEPDATKPLRYAIVRNRVYWALNSTTNNTSRIVAAHELIPGQLTSTFPVINSFPNPITDICLFNSVGMLIAFGDAADIIYLNVLTGVSSTFAAGERAWHIETWHGNPVWSDARGGVYPPSFIRMSRMAGIDQRIITHDPIAIKTIDAKLLIITNHDIYSFEGRILDTMVNNPAWTQGGTADPQIPGKEWSGEFHPFFQQGQNIAFDDYTFIESFGGRIIAWIAGSVQELIQSGARAGWRSTGLSGRRCFGACIADGWLMVSIEACNGTNELWAYDGTGWWRFAQQPMPAQDPVTDPLGLLGVWCWPIATNGNHNDQFRGVTFFKHGTNQIDSWQLRPSTEKRDLQPYQNAAELVTPRPRCR